MSTPPLAQPTPMSPFRRVRVRVRGVVPKRWRKGWARNPKYWRTRIVEDMQWMLNNEPSIHYRQARPFPVKRVAQRILPITTDCSGSTTMLYYSAGTPDPNGNRYDGTGYTGSLRAHTPRRKRVQDCKPGDFIVYGSGAGSHVVIVLEPGNDPLTFSLGQEKGPLRIRHSAEVAAHGSVFTCHNGDLL